MIHWRTVSWSETLTSSFCELRRAFSKQKLSIRVTVLQNVAGSLAAISRDGISAGVTTLSSESLSESLENDSFAFELLAKGTRACRGIVPGPRTATQAKTADANSSS